MKKTIGLMFGILLLISLVSLVSAEYSYLFEKDTTIDLHISCFDTNNSFCSSATNCQISVYYPNQSAVIINQSMTYNETFFNYTLIESQTDIIGEYSAIANCQGTTNGFSEFNFYINPSGKDLSTAQGIIYIILLVIAFFIFWISIYGSFKIPWRNTRDDSGKVVSVNDLKWLKLFLMVFSYLTFMFIMAMTYNITENFIYLGNVSSYFHYVYLILLTFFFPIMVLLPWVVLYVVFQDKKVKKLIERGLPMR